MQLSTAFTAHSAALAAAGGALIGLSATLLLATHGRVAGISGIVGRLLHRHADSNAWRWWFIAGLVGGGFAVQALAPSRIGLSGWATTPLLVVAGLLVGVGTQLGNGCTSGHGVCGLARGSKRSLASTLTFMAVAALVVAVLRKGAA
jgi:uncharacterized membrane protein YedE/YeeE